MSFEQLPGELQEMIFDFYVAETDLRKACVTRLVSKTFRERIEHAIAILPLWRLCELPTLPMEGPQWCLKWSRLFVINRVPWISARPDARQSLTRFVNRVVDRLLGAEFLPEDVEMQTLRPVYMAQILDTLCTTSIHRCMLLLSDSGSRNMNPFSFMWHCEPEPRYESDDEVDQLRDYAEGIKLDDQDMFIAAAAVGNLAALKHYVGRGIDFNDYGKMFSPVWLIVVGTDQDKILSYLLSQLYPLPTNTPSMRKLDKREAGVQTLLDVYKALLHACLRGKVRTGKLLIDFLSQQGILLRLIMHRHPSRIFKNCMRGNCIELLDYVLNKLQYIPKIELRPLLTEHFFWFACGLGRVEIIRYLLQHQYVLAADPHFRVSYQVTDDETDDETDDDTGDEEERYDEEFGDSIPLHHYFPLLEAARISHPEALKVLVEYGAQVSQDPSDISEIHETLLYGYVGSRHATVTLLLENGAVVDKRCLEDILCIVTKIQNATGQVPLDTALTTITLVAALKNAGMMRKDFKDVVTQGTMKTLCDGVKLILDRGPEMPRTPIDFVELAKQCVNWLDEIGWGLPWELEYFPETDW